MELKKYSKYCDYCKRRFIYDSDAMFMWLTDDERRGKHFVKCSYCFEKNYIEIERS